MTRDKEWNDLFAELSDLQHLARAEARAETAPLVRSDDCLKPSQLLRLANGKAVAGTDEHLLTCAFCRRSLAALRKAMAPDPVAREPEPATQDPTATWVLGTGPARRPKPAPVLEPVPAPGDVDGDTTIGGGTQIEWTELAQGRDIKRLRRLLTVRVPFLLEWTGLVGPGDDRLARDRLAQELLAYILGRVSELKPKERFTPALPGWVRAFAAAQGRADRLARLPDLTAVGTEEFATAFVLHNEQPTDHGGKNSVRAVARSAQDVRTAEALRMIPRPEWSEIDPSDWAHAADELYLEVKSELAVVKNELALWE